jgi:ABC-type microcin C transport system duplicated ATPase subunit YejF
VLRCIEAWAAAALRRGAADLLDKVGIPDPVRALDRYPSRVLRRHAAAGDDRQGPGLRPEPA